MSATPVLTTLAAAATTLRADGKTLAADAVEEAALRVAALLDAADDFVSAKTAAGAIGSAKALRDAVHTMRPTA